MPIDDPTMLTLTKEAKAVLEHLFQGGSRPSLRVFLSFLHDSGPRLDLAPDQPTATDVAFSVDGWNFIINEQLMQQAAPVTIDVGPDGFLMHSGLDFSEAGGNCGGACGSH
jgi:Fe-S cluster assembly iron-binding protein IscA